jgi:hypothetical protein
VSRGFGRAVAVSRGFGRAAGESGVRYDLVPYLILAWSLGGIGYFLYIRNRRTDMLDAMGRVWEPAAD